MPAEASRGSPADIETLDRLWQQYNASCNQGDQKACQLRDNYQAIIKQNFPNAGPAHARQASKGSGLKLGGREWQLVVKCFDH